MADTRPILFYISGHGFGHARRSARIIAALRTLSPTRRIIVRTTAPARILAAIGVREIQPTRIDAGVIERDAWTVDAAATAERFISHHDQRDALVAEEIASVARHHAAVVVTDVPSLAGVVAARLGIPCFASSNFTWDWITRPMLAGHPREQEALQSMTSDYASMTAVLRHPFSHPMPQFRRVIDIPIVAFEAYRDRDAILTALLLNDADSRPRVLLAMRGGTEMATLLAGARSMPDVIFHTSQSLPADAPENLRQLIADRVDFAEAMSIHDAVISKLGYGIVCDAISAGTRLLWPRRSGFCEDELFEYQAPRLTPMIEIARQDYLSGRWKVTLERLLAMPFPKCAKPLGGASAAAAIIDAI